MRKKVSKLQKKRNGRHAKDTSTQERWLSSMKMLCYFKKKESRMYLRVTGRGIIRNAFNKFFAFTIDNDPVESQDFQRRVHVKEP